MSVAALVRAALIALAIVATATGVRAEPATYTELLCDVSVNAVPVGNALILRDASGTYYASAEDLTDWRVHLTGRNVRYHELTFYALATTAAVYDENTATLRLTLPAGAFGINSVDFRRLGNVTKLEPKAETGGYLNYDLQANEGTNGLNLTGSFDSAYSRSGDVWSTSGVAVNAGSGFTRLDTAWERDDLPAMTRVRAGDSIVGGTLLPSATRFAGIQWGTDFALDPAFVTVATPVFAGALPSDGTVDVIIDGRQVYQQQLAAGNFLLQNLPLTQGNGDVTLLVRDSSGQVQRVIEPYYATPVLLKAGLSQFEFDGGFVRQNYGMASADYGGGMFSAQGRRGLTSTLTAGGAVAAGSGGETLALETDFVVRNLGQFSATLNERLGAQAGLSDSFAYSYSSRHFSLGGRVATQSPNVGTPGCVVCTADTYALSLNAGVSFGRGSSASLTVARALAPGLPPLRTAVASYSRAFGRNNLTLNLTQSQSDPVTAVSLLYSISLGQRLNAGTTLVSDGVQSSRDISLTSSLPSTLTGTGFSFTDRHDTSGEAINASVTQDLPHVALTLRSFTGSTLTQYGAEAQGSIVMADGLTGFAQTVGQGFGIADVPGYPNVRISANGSEVGRTDKNGKAVLSTLQPLVANVVTLDGDDIPLSANFQSTSVVVAPLLRSPAFARFAPEPSGGAIIAVTDADGAYVPAGSLIARAGVPKTWTVAYEGAAYLDGVVSGRVAFIVRLPNASSCRFELDIPKNLDGMPNLGTAVCR